MAQKLAILGLGGGSGIVAVLFLMGLGLKATGNEILGNIALVSAVVLAIGLGFLGIVGILKRLAS